MRASRHMLEERECPLGIAPGLEAMLDAYSRMIAEMGRKLDLLSEMDSEYLDCLFKDRIQDMRARLSLAAAERDELEKINAGLPGIHHVSER